MKKSKISIRWQLFGYLSLMVGVLLIVLWLFQVVFMEEFYSTIKKNEVVEVADTIERNIDNQHIKELIDNLAASRGVCIVLTDEMGNVCYQENAMRQKSIIGSLSHIQYMYLGMQAEKAGGQAFIEFVPEIVDVTVQNFGGIQSHDISLRNRRNEGVTYAKVMHYGEREYILLINCVTSPVNATVSTIRTQLIYVTIIMIVLAFLISLFIAKKIAQPIIHMSEEAKLLANSTEAIEFEAKGYKEINELSEALTYASNELTKTEGFRRELIANVSHDLRTPLTLISGYAEMMRDLPGENNPENTQIIIDEATRLTALVNDMLDLSKLQAGTQKLDKQTYNFTESIKQIMTRYAALTEQEGYQITFHYDEEVEIEADELKMSQVVYNLINNAIHYTGEDKIVAVYQKIVDNKVRIEIIDTGVGIAKENIPYIWDRYYKVDKTHKRATIGTGLGLSIVRSILEAHGAAYGVESELEKGSIFWFEMIKKN